MELIALLLACIAFPPLGLAILFVVLAVAYCAAWGLLIVATLLSLFLLYFGIWWPACVVAWIWWMLYNRDE